MRTFAVHYRDHVIPQLRNLATAEAACIRADVETFSQACDVVMHHALALGALYLPPHAFRELEDWIPTTLLQAVDAAGQGGAP